MKIFRLLSRIITGLVFVFSGFVKAIDLLGSAYKFQDYFLAFNIDFLQFISLPLSILLCTAEFLTGFSVLTGFRLKTGIWSLFIFMVFFTPLTLVVALINPVSDCGCFGDAIHLTNWQTFGKNIVLLVPASLLFAGRKSVKTIFRLPAEWFIVSLVAVIFVSFSLFNFRYLPVLDFLPYKTGINIPEKMKIPGGAETNKYQTTFVYEKEGVRKEFTINNYPVNDTSWQFIEQRSVLVKKGYVPPIHDFSITTLNNDDITGQVLNNTGYSILMITTKLSQAETNHLIKGFELGFHCLTNNINFYILTASGSDELQNYDNGLQFCLTDETTLKTIIRANPGYVLLRNGTIVGKWSWANIPEKEWFSEDIIARQLESLHNSAGIYLVIIFILSLTLLLMLLYRLLKKKETKNILY